MEHIRPNPIIIHIGTMLERATDDQLRLIYQLTKALVQTSEQNAPK